MSTQQDLLELGVREDTPLIRREGAVTAPATDRRRDLLNFLEAQTPVGRRYEAFIISLIVLNVVAFILGSLFVAEYTEPPFQCDYICDALFFGNNPDNALAFLGIGSTSLLELITVVVFSVEYVLRLVVVDLEDSKYRGVWGRVRYLPTFFSMVDLASTVPFYVDAFVLTQQDLVASSFLRMFRLLRMMRVEGRYDTALTMVDDVYRKQKAILGTALFVGLTTWLTVAALYYLVERRNLDMIYCTGCDDDDVDTSRCVIDEWGVADCSKACKSPDGYCYNMFQSIPSASYYALLNLFGEFPLADQHSVGGQVVGTITAVVAVAVFALPAGIIGNGFEDVIQERRQQEDAMPIVEQGRMTDGYMANTVTTRGRLYNLLHQPEHSTAGLTLDIFVNALVVQTSLTFMIDTLAGLSPSMHLLLDGVELVSVTIFTLEYVARVYSCVEDPKFRNGRVSYMLTFLALVDLLSFAPFWVEALVTGRFMSGVSDASSSWSTLVKSLRLLRILRFERYTHAFTSFDDIFRRNKDILSVTAFTAILFWVFFGAFLYVTERDNPDPEMAANYSTVPNSMWVTLLNLSGEAPLSQYTLPGKIATGILGLFATAVFGIPIGVLGAGFEEVLEEENEDNAEELAAASDAAAARNRSISHATDLEKSCFAFANGMDSVAAKRFELSVYALILVTVAIGVLQTVEGQENTLHGIEWLAVFVFTVEYLIRLVGVGADPEFAPGRNAVTSRLRFMVSFYSIIDLLAIVPFYIVYALPQSLLNDYDEYLRMLRIMRLVKLDKYIPSITLIDDVIRLKFNTLKVAFFAAITLWIIFAALMFLGEHKDYDNALDDAVPWYGCDEDCTMSDRFQNFFDSMVYTGVHLTGDYPIITYNWPSRFVNFFMVIAAVGVVSIPSGLIASGFVEIIQSKQKAKKKDTFTGRRAGDDWYEIRYYELENVPPPSSPLGPKVDQWQFQVNEFLNGSYDEQAKHHRYTPVAYAGRVFIFAVIISNVLAVLLESIPWIDKAVGNEAGNFFDVFEFLSVMVFAGEYVLRLFCAPKNREALYSTIVYATTFFGIVDFLSTVPWFVEQALLSTDVIDAAGDNAKIFRIFRIFRILQLEDFVTAFSKLDNVFRASKDVLKATGLMALIVWVGAAALFFIFEENNPNWRECESHVPLHTKHGQGCFDFRSTLECNEHYPGQCAQKVFTNMPNSMYLTAIFLGGEWAVIDFTWPGRFVCLFLCIVGIGLYAIPIGSLFDSFGAVLGLSGDDDDDDDDDE